MSWTYDTAKGRDGAFRGLLQIVHGHVAARAKELSDGIGEVPLELGSDPVGVLTDLLYSMIFEHAEYRHNLRRQLGDYYEARDTSQAMMIDVREQSAEHLASARAEARLNMLPLPRTWCAMDEAWMQIGASQGRTSLKGTPSADQTSADA